MLVLAVDVHQQVAELAQLLYRHRAAVDERLRRLVGFDRAPQHALAVVEQFLRFQPARRGGGRFEFERGRDLGARATVTDDAGVGALAERERQGVNDDGFSGAGFAGEHRQPAVEAEFQAFDQGDVTDGQMRQHLRVFCPSAAFRVARRNGCGRTDG